MPTPTPSSLASTETLPGSSAVWGLGHLLPCQWAGGVSVRTAWQTAVSAARSVAEQRRALVGRPSRLVAIPQLALSREQGRRLLSLMQRAGQCGWLAPLYPDVTILLEEASAGATTLACDTTLRRFFAGGRVAVYRPVAGGDGLEAFEVVQLAAVAADALTLAAPLSATYRAGSRVAPLIEAELLGRSLATLRGGWTVEANLSALEAVGRAALPGLETPGALPAGFPTHDGLPILTLPAWSPPDASLGYSRDGDVGQVGLANVGEHEGSRSRADFELPAAFLSRADAWAFLRFFDSRAGRTHPFYALSPADLYEPAAITAATVTLQASGPLSDWELRPHVGVLLADGTPYVRGVASVVRAGDLDTVTFDSALPAAPALGAVRSVRPAHLVRFAADEVEERWRTTEQMDTRIGLIELLEEKSITIAGIDRITTTPLAGAWDPTYCEGGAPAPCACPPSMAAYHTVSGGSLGDGNWLTVGVWGGTPTGEILPVTLTDSHATTQGWTCYWGDDSYSGDGGVYRHGDKVVEDHYLTLWAPSEGHTGGLPIGRSGTNPNVYVNGYTEEFFNTTCCWILAFGFFRAGELNGLGNIYWVKERGDGPAGEYTLCAYHTAYSTGTYAFTSLPSETLTVA